MEEEDDPPVDDDFEADLEAEDVGSFALPFVFLDVEELVLESIPMPTPMSLCEEDNFILIQGPVKCFNRCLVNQLFW